MGVMWAGLVSRTAGRPSWRELYARLRYHPSADGWVSYHSPFPRDTPFLPLRFCLFVARVYFTRLLDLFQKIISTFLVRSRPFVKKKKKKKFIACASLALSTEERVSEKKHRPRQAKQFSRSRSMPPHEATCAILFLRLFPPVSSDPDSRSEQPVNRAWDSSTGAPSASGWFQSPNTCRLLLRPGANINWERIRWISSFQAE
jgi:hypothetical protein